MKKLQIIWLAICLLMILQIAAPSVQAAQPDSSVSNGSHSVDGLKPLMNEEKLLETAKAVFVYERNSDTVVYAYHADQGIDPAGMPKLMTALLAVENCALSDRVTVSKAALDAVNIGSVSAGLVRGEELSVEDLLYLMMTKSANDAATVLAEHIAGSQADFVEMMNAKAADLGCRDTVFTNAHGLPDESSTITARDLCRILDAALDNETFSTLFSAKQYTVPATNKSEERPVATSNLMALESNKKYYDSRVIGGKTGATKDGRCLAATAEFGGMELIAIVMGAVPTYEVENIVIKTYGSFEEMAVLLDHVFGTFEYRQILSKDQVVTQYPVTGGANHVAVCPSREISAVLPIKLDAGQLSWVYGPVTGSMQAPITAGQTLSSLQVWYGGICVAETELVAMNTVELWKEPVNANKPVDGDDNKVGKLVLTVLGMIIGIGAVGLGIWLGLRAIRRAIVKNRRKRRRKEQRRRPNA